MYSSLRLARVSVAPCRQGGAHRFGTRWKGVLSFLKPELMPSILPHYSQSDDLTRYIIDNKNAYLRGAYSRNINGEITEEQHQSYTDQYRKGLGAFYNRPYNRFGIKLRMTSLMAFTPFHRIFRYIDPELQFRYKIWFSRNRCIRITVNSL